MSKVVIWGLKNTRHSHKYIHKGFYENFIRLGHEAIWVNDLRKNQELVKPGDTVLAVDVSSTYLPVVKNAKYVLHNLSPNQIGIDKNYIVIQVHTNNVKGEKLGGPWLHWDEKSRTLFQPWGVPSPDSEWLAYSSKKSKSEFWVGSIWNNSLNQGNSRFMSEYKLALSSHDIKFSQRGNSSIFSPSGISELGAMKLVNKSRIGASVVGEWQKTNEYIPCRFFKNIASGAIPSSNADFSALLGKEGGIFNSNPSKLIDEVLTLDERKAKNMILDAKAAIAPYTYKKAIYRILDHL